MYDRTKLRAAAGRKGIEGFEGLGSALGLSRATAYRLWRGIGKPAADTAAAVQREYGLGAAELIEQAAA